MQDSYNNIFPDLNQTSNKNRFKYQDSTRNSQFKSLYGRKLLRFPTIDVVQFIEAIQLEKNENKYYRLFRLQIKTIYTFVDVGFASVVFKHGNQDYAIIKKLYIGKAYRKIGSDVKVIRELVLHLFSNFSVAKIYYKFK